MTYYSVYNLVMALRSASSLRLPRKQQRTSLILHLECLLLVTLSLLRTASSLTTCDQISSCKASTDEGEIDLSPLAGEGNSPRFTKIKDKTSEFLYSYNPCKGWTDKTVSSTNTCKNVSVCQYQTIIGTYLLFGIGAAETAEFTLDKSSGHCVLSYVGTTPGASTKVKIELVCSEDVDGTLDEFSRSDSDHLFTTKLHTKYACLGTSLSVGTILVIVFLSLLVVYVIAGILFNKFSRGKDGKEVFPNYSFWSEIPSLILAGCVLTWRKCAGLCSKGTTKSSYESIPG